MVNIKINGREVEVLEGSTILEAALANGLVIPTLCHLKGLNEVGACRVCVVEVKGAERLVASCNTEVAEGMEIETNSPRVLEARKQNLQLILSGHDCNCLVCSRNGNCRLQTLARNMNLLERQPYPVKKARDRWDAKLPLVRTDSRCISCLRCVSICEREQGIGVWDLLGPGARTRVGVRNGKTLAEAGCTLCGQCIAHCPVSALNERDDTAKFLAAVRDPSKVVVLQVAPAALEHLGDGLGLPSGPATGRHLVAAFRRLGVKAVVDASFAADCTVRATAEELRAAKGVLFASWCPGWVRFLKSEYPDLVSRLSFARSPQEEFAVAARRHWAEKTGKDPKDVFCACVTSCTALKDGAADALDCVLTTREAIRLFKSQGIEVAGLPEADFDALPGMDAGAGVPLGTADGALARAVAAALDGRKVRSVAVRGLADARRIAEDVRSGRAEYDFVEALACPDGCAGGGGQPPQAKSKVV